MIQVSNADAERIIRLLYAVRSMAGSDTRTANLKRLAILTQRKLKKKLHEKNKDNQRGTDGGRQASPLQDA